MTRPRATLRALAAALVPLVPACAAKSTALTEVVAVVDSDLVLPIQADEVTIEAIGPGGKTVSSNAPLAEGTALPLTISLVPSGSADEQATVRVTAKLAGAAVLTRTARFHFVADGSRALPLSLVRACLGVVCGDGSTCGDDGACVPFDVPDGALATWPGAPPAHRDAAQPSGARVVGVALGETHSCALTRAGTVFCWGRNDDRELGTSSLATVGVGRVVLGIDGAIAIAAAPSYSCALRTDKTVWCWGLDENGQLGDGNGGSTATRAEPAPVVGLAGAVQLSAGEGHACAVDASGAVWCWGSNARGQLGNGTTADAGAPARVTGLDGAATAVAAAETHTCALLASGRVQCWGGDEYGQLGRGQSASDAPSPVTVAGITDAAAIAAGSYHTCVVHKTRAVSCWGRNNRGQLGDGTATDRASPIDVPGLSDSRELAAGELHTCARSESGGVSCWGANDFGQLGDGTTADRARPVLLDLHADELRAGNYHTCARRNLDALACWGRNDGAQLGDGTTTARSSPTATLGLP